MTNTELKGHFTSMLAAEGLTFPNVQEHIDRAVQAGLKDFWGAHDWTFRSIDTTLAITATAESYDLVDTFAGFRSVRERTSDSGTDLGYKTKEDFDRSVPRPDALSSGTPDWFTIFRDADNKKWKIAFYPRPSAAMTIYMDILITAPTEANTIPDDYISGLMAFIAKHAYPYGHIGRVNAGREAVMELSRLRKIDKLDRSKMTVMFDDTIEQSTFTYDWV